MRVELRLWNAWYRPRLERYADGSNALFFGVGKLLWQRKIKPPNVGLDAGTELCDSDGKETV